MISILLDDCTAGMGSPHAVPAPNASASPNSHAFRIFASSRYRLFASKPEAGTERKPHQCKPHERHRTNATTGR
jgi:hypothetical protein